MNLPFKENKTFMWWNSYQTTRTLFYTAGEKGQNHSNCIVLPSLIPDLVRFSLTNNPVGLYKAWLARATGLRLKPSFCYYLWRHLQLFSCIVYRRCICKLVSILVQWLKLNIQLKFTTVCWWAAAILFTAGSAIRPEITASSRRRTGTAGGNARQPRRKAGRRRCSGLHVEAVMQTVSLRQTGGRSSLMGAGALWIRWLSFCCTLTAPLRRCTRSLIKAD